MDLEFKRGDRVKLTPAGAYYYGGTPSWIPQLQGGGTDGTVLFAGDRPHKPGATARPYFVQWDNSATNSYRVEDLQAAEPRPEPEEKPGTNVISFKSL